jgi:hypothetical protein
MFELIKLGTLAITIFVIIFFIYKAKTNRKSLTKYMLDNYPDLDIKHALFSQSNDQLLIETENNRFLYISNEQGFNKLELTTKNIKRVQILVNDLISGDNVNGFSTENIQSTLSEKSQANEQTSIILKIETKDGPPWGYKLASLENISVAKAKNELDNIISNTVSHANKLSCIPEA